MKRLLPLMLLLTACSTSHYRPIVDSHNVDMTRYETDLRECQTLAEQSNSIEKAIASVLMGAALGAALGAEIGAPWNAPEGAAAGAALGAILGIVGGATSGATGRKETVYNCMRQRDYTPLDD